jgi:hypothetical protein
VNPILEHWNAQLDAKNGQKLVIEPRITDLHKPSGATRFFAGAMAGDGFINVKVRITEQPSGKVVAEPEFYRRASARAGAWTMGAHDNAMLEKVAALVASYLNANYAEAVGGATGYEHYVCCGVGSRPVEEALNRRAAEEGARASSCEAPSQPRCPSPSQPRCPSPSQPRWQPPSQPPGD